MGEMAVGELREQIAHIGIGFDAVHLARADQAGEAGPVPAALVMTGEQRVAAVHGRAADGVFHEVGINVDALRANKRETIEWLKFTLEGVGERTHGYAFTDITFAGCWI